MLVRRSYQKQMIEIERLITMAIHIKTNTPQKILEILKDCIDSKKIETWSYDSEGDFTHVSQWKNLAWMRPKIENKELIFGIIGQKGVKMSKAIYGIYHGRFSEMLLTHFDSEFESLSVTSFGDSYDNFT